jgi:hypothetical protein
VAYQRKPFNRRSAVRDADLIVIATEGVCSEVRYFNGLIEDQHTPNSKIKVHVIERKDPSLSSPNHVLEELDSFKDKWKLEEGDELWMVIDFDRWGTGKLSEIASKCIQKKYRLAISNPCFEIWLLLHFKDLTSNLNIRCAEAEDQLKVQLGSYNKTNLDFSKFRDHIDAGIENSKRLDTNQSDRWCQPIGSRVYQLVTRIKLV